MSELTTMAEHVATSPLQDLRDPWALSPAQNTYVSPHADEIVLMPFPQVLCITLPEPQAPVCPHCQKPWGFNLTVLLRKMQQRCPHCRENLNQKTP